MTSRVWLEGTVSPIRESSDPDAGDGTQAPRLLFRGALETADSSLRLPGVTVALDLRIDGRADPRAIGATRSDRHGGFVLAPSDPWFERTSLAQLAQLGAIVDSIVRDDRDRPIAEMSTAIAAWTLPVVLPVNLKQRAISRQAWHRVGRRLGELRIARISDFVAALSDRDSALLAGLTGIDRVAMLEAAERAFLDPDGVISATGIRLPTMRGLGNARVRRVFLEEVEVMANDARTRAAVQAAIAKVDAFGELEGVDWVLDPEAIEAGLIGFGLGRFADGYQVSPLIGTSPVGTPSPMVRYRDYLLAIWTTLAPEIEHQPPVLTPTQALEQLEHRFHQRFTTVDETETVANEVAISILAEILTAPSATEMGFGLAPGSLPARAGRPARAYLDELIDLAPISATELSRRYRIDLTRSDAERSSPVLENIHTLQGFFRDGFQGAEEPKHVEPDVLDEPIIPAARRGKAPFFLYYEEWLRQDAPFYAENHFDIRRWLSVAYSPTTRDELNKMADGSIKTQVKNAPRWEFIRSVLAISDALEEGHGHMRNSEFELARRSYERAAGSLAPVGSAEFAWTNVAAIVNAWRSMPVTNLGEVASFEDDLHLQPGISGYGDDPTWAWDRMSLRLAVYAMFVIPFCLGDVEWLLGRYSESSFHFGQVTRFLVAAAREGDPGGYKPHYLEKAKPYIRGELPYTAVIGGSPNYPAESQHDVGYEEDIATMNSVEMFRRDRSLNVATVTTTRYFKLHHAGTLLDWADELYRADSPPSVARAREVYKAVLFLWGEPPPISPNWPGDWFLFAHHDENPAIVAQLERARLGFYQIEANLNFLGHPRDTVPILRYRPLKERADRLGAMAHATQNDLLRFMGNVESALESRMRLEDLVKRSQYQVQIADEQTAIADHEVKVAKDQVSSVEDAIKAKTAEIADADSMFGQFRDFFKSLPDSATSGFTGGVEDAIGGAAVPAVPMMKAFKNFVVGGYSTMSGMADAANRRRSELDTLMNKTLPAAKATVEARGHAVAIAKLQHSIATSELDLARNLIAFADGKFLDLRIWSALANISRRLLRRYLDLGTQTAWLAQRALAFEQAREVTTIRLDYHPERFQGITGADILEADLAELENVWLDGVRRSAPLQRTVSLVRDYPVQYGQLRRTGTCRFRTTEHELRSIFPGMRRFRIRAVSPSIVQVDRGTPAGGLLINEGISYSFVDDQIDRVVVRGAEGIPISEFQLGDDMGIYGLPDDALLPFEGSHLDTSWELRIPQSASFDRPEIFDVLMTFDLRAEFVPAAYSVDVKNAQAATPSWLLLRGAVMDAEAIKALRGGAADVTITFDPRAVDAGTVPTQRTVTNIAVMMLGQLIGDINLSVSIATPVLNVLAVLHDGIAMSANPPDVNQPAPSPNALDVFAGSDAQQAFRVRLTKAANPGLNFAPLRDVWLAIEYSAEQA